MFKGTYWIQMVDKARHIIEPHDIDVEKVLEYSVTDTAKLSICYNPDNIGNSFARINLLRFVTGRI